MAAAQDGDVVVSGSGQASVDGVYRPMAEAFLGHPGWERQSDGVKAELTVSSKDRWFLRGADASGFIVGHTFHHPSLDLSAPPETGWVSIGDSPRPELRVARFGAAEADAEAKVDAKAEADAEAEAGAEAKVDAKAEADVEAEADALVLKCQVSVEKAGTHARGIYFDVANESPNDVLVVGLVAGLGTSRDRAHATAYACTAGASTGSEAVPGSWEELWSGTLLGLKTSTDVLFQKPVALKPGETRGFFLHSKEQCILLSDGRCANNDLSIAPGEFTHSAEPFNNFVKVKDGSRFTHAGAIKYRFEAKKAGAEAKVDAKAEADAEAEAAALRRELQRWKEEAETANRRAEEAEEAATALEFKLLQAQEDATQSADENRRLRSRLQELEDQAKTQQEATPQGGGLAAIRSLSKLTIDEVREILGSFGAGDAASSRDAFCAFLAKHGVRSEEKFQVTELMLGQPDEAAQGVKGIIGLTTDEIAEGMKEGLSAIEKEVATHGRKEDKDNLKYILRGVACTESDLPPHVVEDYKKGSYHGGKLNPGDYDRNNSGKTFEDFCKSTEAVLASLEPPHVCAMRLYTTSSFRLINGPVRGRKKPHPLGMTVFFLDEGIKKLRAVAAKLSPQEFQKQMFLWRGMKNMSLDIVKFEEQGGAELAPMSTTRDRAVAQQYAASEQPLVLKLKTRGLGRGVSLRFLSVYPLEDEYLYPLATYLQPEEHYEEDGFQIVVATPQMS